MAVVDVATFTREGPDPVPREPEPRSLKTKKDNGDRVFHAIAFAAGLVVLAIMGSVGLFLAFEAADALGAVGWSFVTTSEWEVDRGRFGISAVMLGTGLIAAVAVVVAMPIAMGTALFITDIAPPRLRSTLVSLVDLMAAVPSVVYGLWGLFFFQDAVLGLSRWLATWFGWIPIFAVDGVDPSAPLNNATVYTASVFIAGIVVALMVMPIQCSVMREVFSQVPVGEREGAFALGATRWGMIRIVSLPFARGGIIGGTMLGLGRALGETIAVVLIISPKFDINFHILESGANSVASLIALRYAEASDRALSALFAAGLALFIITLAVNFTASWFVSKSRSGAASEA
ncbi:MAG: phosphate ABC transporter permease subunit PstC [Acidimicrobiales bacterium]|jgi:phosphate transport system permease protein|nr:phosphate ABC transporter permease subunit PstC [Acidimicrobiales bacterium]